VYLRWADFFEEMETEKLGVGSEVWLKSQEKHAEFIVGEVTSRDGPYVTIKSPQGKARLNVNEDEVYRVNPRIVEDMTALQYFHIPGILHNLRERSLEDAPYTFLGGSVLVAVNPLKEIADPNNSLGQQKAVQFPHPYAIAETALQQLTFAATRKNTGDKMNQSIVVGGESGAGKTESSKMVLKHLVARSEASGGGDSSLDQRLLDTNPILEAFGNAATVRNSNSSRFGKFMKLHFKRAGGQGREMAISGASVETYLLERSRVTSHSDGERTFHVFYQMVEGADKSLRKKMGLDQSFEYLKPQPILDAGGKKLRPKSVAKVAELGKFDKENFNRLVKALKTIRIDEKSDMKLADLLSLLSGLLHLGNAQFKEKGGATSDESEPVDAKALQKAADLLGLDDAALTKLFTERKVKVGGNEIVSFRDPEGCKFALDAVVKAVYVQTFEWLVDRITAELSQGIDPDADPFIGILDIFGFESFRRNDFEQLLINYTNESLQNTFNQQVFEAEADLFRKEGLLVENKDRAPPPNNEEALILLGGVKKDQKQPGILGLIDAETQSPQPSDSKLNSAIHRVFRGSEALGKTHPKDMKFCFTVVHYAGEVKYTTGRFIERNVDKVPEEVQQVMGSSSLPMLKDMFQGSKAAGTKLAGRAMKKATSTIAGRFQQSIEELVSTLDATKASFIRCIKPNPRMDRKSGTTWFNNDYVIRQLFNLSIPQTAEVLKGGLPTRIPFSQFVDQYKSLLPPEAIKAWKLLGRGEDRPFVKALFYAFDITPDMYKVGATRVFFRSGMLDALNDVLNTASSGKLDDQIADKFAHYLRRWRLMNFFSMMFACKAFLDIHQMNLRRGSSATILQRFARRRARLARLRAEEARRKEEERKRKEEEARRAAEEARKAEEKAKKERQAAEKKNKLAAAQAARQRELRAEQIRKREEESIRQQEEMKRDFEAQLKAAEKDRLKAEATEEKETQKAIEASGGTTKFEEATFEAKTKKVTFAADENDDEDDAVVFTPEESKKAIEKAEKIMKRASRAPRMEVKEPEATVIKGAEYREVTGNAKKVMKVIRNSVVGALGRGRGRGRGGDEWKKADVVINGVKLEIYESYDEAKKKGKLLLRVDILENKNWKLEDKESHSLLKMTANSKDGKSKKSIYIKAPPDSPMNKALMDSISFYKAEQDMAKKYQMGVLEKYNTEELKLARDLYKNGVITAAEFEAVLAAQVTSEDQILQAEFARYGETGATPDFRVICEGCSETYYMLPGAEKPENCDFCGAELPYMDPDTLLADMWAAREIQNGKFREDASSSKGNTTFPVFATIPFGEFLVDVPTIEQCYDPDEFRTIYRFSYEARLYSGGEGETSAEDFSFGASWSEWKAFLNRLKKPAKKDKKKLSSSVASKLPNFPEDPSTQDLGLSQRAKTRKSVIDKFVADLIVAMSGEKDFWNHPSVCVMFNLPEDPADILAEGGRLCTMDQLKQIAIFADSVLAQKTFLNELNATDQEAIAKSQKDLEMLLEKIQNTTDIDQIKSDPVLRSMEEDQQEALAAHAADVAAQVQSVLD